jgi:hypothetical protein
VLENNEWLNDVRSQNCISGKDVKKLNSGYFHTIQFTKFCLPDCRSKRQKCKHKNSNNNNNNNSNNNNNK